MDLKWVSLAFFILFLICIPIWPYSRGWPIVASAFFGFVGVLTLLVSVFAKHGSSVWKGRGHG